MSFKTCSVYCAPETTKRRNVHTKRVFPLACLVGLLGSSIGMDYAFAAGTCT